VATSLPVSFRHSLLYGSNGLVSPSPFVLLLSPILLPVFPVVHVFLCVFAVQPFLVNLQFKMDTSTVPFIACIIRVIRPALREFAPFVF
jgi:hypothetical protein